MLRGWGAALDELARVLPDGADGAIVRYRGVITQHPVAGRELEEEFYARQRTAEWVIPPVPPLRDA